MGRFIVKLKDSYLIWSTIVDAPVSYGMSLFGLREYIKQEHGNQGLRDLPRRLQRVEQFGTSLVRSQSAEDVIASNHAGPGESELTFDEIYQAYCERISIRGGWTPD